jgi:hypothetical protein
MNLPPTISDASVTLTFGTAGVYYGYATIADVKFEFANASSFSKLDNSTVAQEITYAAQELQEVLATTYQMPYVGSDAGILLTLRNVNAKLAAANIAERYFQATVPNASAMAVELRDWAETMVASIQSGLVQWGAPYGDAVFAGEHPVTPKSALTLGSPNAGQQDRGREPIFRIGRDTRFRPPGL